VPTPTAEAVAYNKKEQASRTASTTYERFLTNMGKRPDLSGATRVGQPSLSDAKETDAPRLAREIDSMVQSESAKKGSGAIVAESVNASDEGAGNQAAPRSAEPPVSAGDVPAEAPAQLNESAPSSSADASSSSSSAPNEKDDPKDASTSRKAKKKHRFHIPIPL
jgi:hypothetical protein